MQASTKINIIAAAALLALAVTVWGLVVVIQRDNASPSNAEQANAVCKGFGGVRSIDASGTGVDSVVCEDGKARSLWD
jgi:hypothetical protein